MNDAVFPDGIPAALGSLAGVVVDLVLLCGGKLLDALVGGVELVHAAVVTWVEPDVGMGCAEKDCFNIQWNIAARLSFGPEVVTAGVVDHAHGIAVTAGHVPDAGVGCAAKYSWASGCYGCLLGKGVVAVCDLIEKVFGFGTGAGKRAEKADPFGTPERMCFHEAGGEHNGQAGAHQFLGDIVGWIAAHTRQDEIGPEEQQLLGVDALACLDTLDFTRIDALKDRGVVNVFNRTCSDDSV